MSHPEFWGNLSSRNDAVKQEKERLGKKSLLSYTVTKENDRRSQEVRTIDVVQV
jgi:hypothetical protein